VVKIGYVSASCKRCALRKIPACGKIADPNGTDLIIEQRV